mgnify:CR=1 FL=1
MKRLLALLSGTVMTLLLCGGALAQSETPDGRSYESHMTPEQLRRCIQTDYEMTNVYSLIGPRREQMRESQRQLQQTHVQSPDYADLRSLAEQQRLQYNSLVEDYQALAERFNANCTAPYYQVDYVKARNELGYGWSSQ